MDIHNWNQQKINQPSISVMPTAQKPGEVDYENKTL